MVKKILIFTLSISSLLSAINLEKLNLKELYTQTPHDILYAESMPENVSPKQFFDKLNRLYAKNNPVQLISTSSGTQKTDRKIPHTIHLIWFGPSQLSPLFQKWHREWKAKHTDWDFIIWNEKAIKEKFPEKLFNQKIYDQAQGMSDYPTMSKITRYEILHKFGGLFIEPNLKCYESFEPLHILYDFYAGLAPLKSYGAISNSVIGSRANHPILKACLEQIKKSDGPLPTDQFSIGNWMMRHLSNRPLTQAVYEKINQKNYVDVILPQSFFDGNKVKKRFYHDRSSHEPSNNFIERKPEAFCAQGEYCCDTRPQQPHDRECLEPFFQEDAASLEFLAQSYPAQEKTMVIVIASYNNKTWYKRNLTSVFMQKYTNYRVIYIDDASSDGTGNLVETYLKEHQLEQKITLIKNKENLGAAANFYHASELCQDHEIMVHLDGDDWLAHENALAVLNKFYDDPNTWMTYGQFISYPMYKPGYCKPFPPDFIERNAFREYPRWISHHLRTHYIWLFRLIKLDDLKINGKFLPVTWDHALMFAMLEMSGYRAKCVPYLLSIYNKANPLNDVKVRGREQSRFVGYIRRQQKKYTRLQEKPQITQILSSNSLSDMSLSSTSLA